MAKSKLSAMAMAQARKLNEAIEILRSLGFAGRQSNEAAGYTLLALLDLEPLKPWSKAAEPRRGITPIIAFVAQAYNVRYAPNTRETIRDEAVKYFVETGMLIRNPDNPSRPVNSGKTVYQIEPTALALFRTFGTLEWDKNLKAYLSMRERIVKMLRRQRKLKRIPVVFPSGKKVTISPGGQNPLIKTVIEQFCTAFAPGGTIVYIGDAENKFLHLDAEYLKQLNVIIPAPAKMPDVVIHDTRKNWLLLIEAVTSAGPVDAKRRNELKALFAGCMAGLVFVTAFSTREVMRNFLTQISWETEVWVAEDPDHLIHFNGERFLGPYPS
jgi:BsuBI/PstI restriction endonuclease domain/BsuBI/PstI restriction endonuclease HTH domain